MTDSVKRRGGRKTKLTPDLQRRICDILRAGNFIDATCAHVGIDESTFYRWQERNSEFCEAVKKAQADAEINTVTRIRLAGQAGDWKADAWFLERTRPKKFGKSVNVSGDPERPLEVRNRVALSDLVAEARAQAAAAAARAAAEAEDAWDPIQQPG